MDLDISMKKEKKHKILLLHILNLLFVFLLCLMGHAIIRETLKTSTTNTNNWKYYEKNL